MNGFSENCEKYVDPAWAMVNYMNAGRKFGFSMYSSARDWMKLLFRNNIKCMVFSQQDANEFRRKFSDREIDAGLTYPSRERFCNSLFFENQGLDKSQALLVDDDDRTIAISLEWF